jgi:hypothetical protein
MTNRVPSNLSIERQQTIMEGTELVSIRNAWGRKMDGIRGGGFKFDPDRKGT